MTGTIRSLVPAGALMRPLRGLLAGHWGWFTILVTGSVLAGFGQALVLLVVVRLGLEIAESGTLTGATTGVFDVFPDDTGSLLAIGCVAIVAVLALEVLNTFIQARLAAQVMTTSRVELYDAYADASADAQGGARKGELAQLIAVNGAWTGTATMTAASGAISFGNFSALLVSAALISPVAAAGTTVVLVALLVGLRPLGRRSRGQSASMAEKNTDLAGSTGHAVALAREIRTAGVEDRFRQQVHHEITGLATHWRRVRFLSRLAPALFRNATLLFIFAAVAAVHLLDVGALPELGATLLIMVRALSFAQGFQSSTQELNGIVPWVDAMNDAKAALKTDPVTRTGATIDTVGEIRLDGVTFAYDTHRNALDGIDLTIAPGEAVGVVGPSGSGKSTLIALLLRLRNPTDGRITSGEVDLRTISLSSWYRQVALVPQDPMLLPGSIADNIRFLHDIDDDEVSRAAAMSRVDEMAAGMPEGLDSIVGDGGNSLSGGQRQRIALARALAGRPSVLILDEPTGSTLDLPSEALVTETLEALRGEVTVLVVAHRLTSLAACDRLVVLESGRISATGTHDDLTGASEFYREAVRLASAGIS